MDVGVDEEPRAGVADLAGVVENPPDRSIHRPIEVGQIRQEDLRTLAAGLQADALEIGLARIDQQLLADNCRSGEADLRHVRVQRQRPASRLSGTVDHIEDARGTAGLDEQFRQFQAAQRRELGGFQDHAVARRQGRSDLPGRHQQRIVPGRDRAHHAQRLTRDIVQRLVRRIAHHAGQLVDALAEIAKGHHGLGDIEGQRVGDRLAHRQAVQQRQIGRMGRHQIGEAGEHRHAVARRHAPPAAVVPCGPGAGDRPIDVTRPAAGDLGDEVPGRGVDHRQGRPVSGRDACAVDEQARRDPQGARGGPPARVGRWRRRGHWRALDAVGPGRFALRIQRLGMTS